MNLKNHVNLGEYIGLLNFYNDLTRNYEYERQYFVLIHYRRKSLKQSDVVVCDGSSFESDTQGDGITKRRVQLT